VSLVSGLYKAGLRVAKEVSDDIPTLMDKFGTYGRVTRPGNVPGWAAPSRLEARKARKTGDSNYEFSDHMERGEAAVARSIGSTRVHLAKYAKAKGIKHTQKTPPLKGTSDSFTRAYAPRGGDLEPGHFGKTSKSKKDLLAERRKAAVNRKMGMR
jgi:hypothetical protein